MAWHWKPAIRYIGFKYSAVTEFVMLFQYSEVLFYWLPSDNKAQNVNKDISRITVKHLWSKENPQRFIYMFKRVPRRVKLSSSPLHIAVY